MLQRQRGALNLFAVGIFSVIFAAGAMAALLSIRSERNLFAEGANQATHLAGEAPGAMLHSAKLALAAADTKIRRCVIDGKPVVSNTECTDKNPTSRDIKPRETRGVDAVKKPVTPPVEASSDPVVDKMIEKQLR